MSNYSTAAILAKLEPSLSSGESRALVSLNMAIAHAIHCAHQLPSTLSPVARDLIVTKLCEADHWCLESARLVAD